MGLIYLNDWLLQEYFAPIDMEELRASVKRQRADSRTRNRQRPPSMSEHEDSLRRGNEAADLNSHPTREGLKPKSDTINSSKASTYQGEYIVFWKIVICAQLSMKS